MSKTERMWLARLAKGPRIQNYPSVAVVRLLARGLIGKTTIGKKPRESRVVYLVDHRI